VDILLATTLRVRTAQDINRFPDLGWLVAQGKSNRRQWLLLRLDAQHENVTSGELSPIDRDGLVLARPRVELPTEQDAIELLHLQSGWHAPGRAEEMFRRGSEDSPVLMAYQEGTGAAQARVTAEGGLISECDLRPLLGWFADPGFLDRRHQFAVRRLCADLDR